MSRHEWRERTDGGETRLVTAERFGKRWTLRARLKSEPDWTTLDPIPADDLHTLREILEAKYRRGSVPFELIAEIDALLEDAP
ncbi:MAG: hypothetical protein H6825_05980 [Planctomycetes bacterium]|nr:hypothetical protein [Planctomycetota bacterium]